MMKKIISILTLSLLFICAFAQQRVAERTYISTDKEVYVAGDAIWCSAYCVDITNDKLSQLSNIVYLELHSSTGVVQTGKIALINGRGAGKISLVSAIPTGNYKLIAYTAQNKNEVDYNFDSPWSKTISIFNTLSKERVADGVKVVDNEEYIEIANAAPKKATTQKVFAVLPKNITFEPSSTIPICLENSLKDAVSLSISIYHDDGIYSDQTPVVTDFVKALNLPQSDAIKFENVVAPEYEGEVISAKLSGPDAAKVHNISTLEAYLSVPNEKSDVYASAVDSAKKMIFYTNNIYGEKEIVCELEGLDSTYICHIELESPFVNPKTSNIPQMKICDNLREKLVKRGIAMQIERSFVADTLYDYLPIRENPLLQNSDRIRYVLDDYVRFPLMEEVFIEYVEQLRVRKQSDGKYDIQVRMEDIFNKKVFANDASLMMLDGIPIFDHDKIFNYDPLLVKTIDIYPYSYIIGNKEFDGVVNFATYKRNLPSMTFGENVRIVNFQGVSFPVAYTCESLIGSKDYPDYRETIYWHPIVNMDGGQSIEFNCVTPAYSGSFIIVIEGISSTGEAIYERSSFKVE